jgi:MFS transporter, DHA3 family, tetracycline resistance protein
MAVADSEAGRRPRLHRRLGYPGQPADDGVRAARRGRTGRLRRPGHPADDAGIRAAFLRWTFLRAVFHRGYVLASGLYFVVAAHLSAAQLVLLGAVMALTLLLSDIPAGVWSDAFSRKWPLVIGHGFLAAGMMLTGAVTTFGWLLVTQVLWGLGWAFSSGADVAWLTDELAQPSRIDRTLTARARWELAGGAVGMITFGVLGWAAGLGTAVVASGAGMALLGAFVAARFGEDNFTPVRQHRWSASLSIFRRGLTLAHRDRAVLVMLIATMLINGAGVITWLFPRQLVNLGFPAEFVLWYTTLCVLSSVAGVVALRIVEARIDGAGAARRSYVLACFAGALGLIVLAYAPDALLGGAGVLLARAISFNVTRAVSVVWVNRRTTSDVRTTLHSFLSQAESTGEIIGGFALAALAQASGISVTLLASAALIAATGALVTRSRPSGEPGSPPGGGPRWRA